MRRYRLAWFAAGILVVGLASMRRRTSADATEPTRTRKAPPPASPVPMPSDAPGSEEATAETLVLRVVDEAGAPVQGVDLRIADAHTKEWWATPLLTDAEGRVTTNGTPPFTVLLYETQAHERRWSEARGGEVTVTLHTPLCTLRLDARMADGQPLDHVWADVFVGDGLEEQVRSEQGTTWLFTQALPCGAASLVVTGARGRKVIGMAWTTVDLVRGTPARVTVTLRDPHRTAIHPVGPDGTPVSDPSFKVGRAWFRWFADGGEPLVPVDPLGGADVTVVAPGFHPRSLHLEPASADVTVTLQPTGHPGVDLTLGLDGPEVLMAQSHQAAASPLQRGDVVTAVEIAGVPLPDTLMAVAPWETTTSVLWLSPWLPATFEVRRGDDTLDVDL